MQKPRSEMDLLTPTPGGSGLLIAPGGAIPDVLLLELIAERLDASGTSVSDRVLSMIAKRLLERGVTDEGSAKLAYAIGGVVARIARVKEDRPSEFEANSTGDPALALLGVRKNQTASSTLRAWWACDLGDRSLMYAARWGGRHLDSVMKAPERRKYCVDMAGAAYEDAVYCAGVSPRQISGWMSEMLPPLISNISTVCEVLTDLHDPEFDTPTPSSPFLL